MGVAGCLPCFGCGSHCAPRVSSLTSALTLVHSRCSLQAREGALTSWASDHGLQQAWVDAFFLPPEKRGQEGAGVGEAEQAAGACAGWPRGLAEGGRRMHRVGSMTLRGQHPHAGGGLEDTVRAESACAGWPQVHREGGIRARRAPGQCPVNSR